MANIMFKALRICNSEMKCNFPKNEKLFCQFFAAFLESTPNFDHFERKDDRHRECIFEITDCENLC